MMMETASLVVGHSGPSAVIAALANSGLAGRSGPACSSSLSAGLAPSGAHNRALGASKEIATHANIVSASVDKVTDELENQVITNANGSPVPSERKRKLIGDEFYGGDGGEDDGDLNESEIKIRVEEVVEEGVGGVLEVQCKPIPTPTIIKCVVRQPPNGVIENTEQLFQHLNGHEGLPEGSLPLYNGGSGIVVAGSLPPLSLPSSIMTATTGSVLDSVLVSSLVKNEPEDLAPRRHPSSNGSPPLTQHIQLDVAARRLMTEVDKAGNMVTSVIQGPEGDSHIVLTAADLEAAPGFNSTPYDPPPFSSAYSPSGDGQQPGTPSRMYSVDSYTRDQDMYASPGEPGYRNTQDVQYNKSYYGTVGINTTDLPTSPDSGIGGEQIPRDNLISSDSSFDYHNDLIDQNTIRKHWHDYGSRNSDQEKVQIPKVYSPFGFHYMLDAPTSSSVRREDDKVTYINKGQFYGVTLDFVPDPELANLKSPTVKTVIMLVFRDGKSQEEEIKAWQFWHQRQHSVKQRIIDVDTKNSIGLVGHIEELSHNALAVYWNPLESPAKVNLAVQCLSTDFSTQKGVKGLPLHVQVDTYEDPRAEVGSSQVYHRGYCQIKIFCDKGAERKLRDEERRAAKRRMTPSGKRRLDEMYHDTSDRSEFYSPSDLSKTPTLFSPPDDPEKSSQLSADLGGFYSQQRILDPMKPLTNGDLLTSQMSLSPVSVNVEPILKRAPDRSPLPYTTKEAKRGRMIPPLSERIMIYVRQETEDVYTPLHLVPPTVTGLITAIENKYKINACNIRYLYRKNRDGIIAKIDDDMLRHYCNEDVFLMQVMVTEGPGGEETMVYDITLSELQSAIEH